MRIALLLPLLFFALHAAVASPEEPSIAGVQLGDRLEDARARLDQIGKTSGRAASSGKSASIKEAWALDSTEFANVALKTDAEGRVVWITGFVRSGSGIPFERLGDLRKAKPHSSALAIWDRMKARPPSRLIARGEGRVAKAVTLISIGGQKNESATEDD